MQHGHNIIRKRYYAWNIEHKFMLKLAAMPSDE